MKIKKMKNRKPTVFILIAVALTVADFSGCKKHLRHKNIVCVMDLSDDPQFPGRVAYYERTASKLLIERADFNDRIVFIPVDHGSLTNNAEIAEYTFKSQGAYTPDGTSPLDEDSLATQNLNVEKARDTGGFKNQLARVVNARKDLTRGTDLISALNNTLKYYQPDEDNELVLFSDMMNWSAELKMEPGSFSAGMIAEKLTIMPPLDGKNIQVFIHTGALTNIPNEHFLAVEAFWTKYFRLHHFILADYSSTSTDALIKLMGQK
jgi:hypothetical protein